MGFRQADSEGRGGYARIWSVEDKGNYSLAKVSTSKKRKDDDSYETDFQDGFVRLVGDAHKKVKNLDVPEKGISIQITSCEATTPYDAKNKKAYHNYTIFAFNVPDENDGSKAKSGSKTAKKSSHKKAKEVDEEEEDPDDLPF